MGRMKGAYNLVGRVSSLAQHPHFHFLLYDLNTSAEPSLHHARSVSSLPDVGFALHHRGRGAHGYSSSVGWRALLPPSIAAEDFT